MGATNSARSLTPAAAPAATAARDNSQIAPYVISDPIGGGQSTSQDIKEGFTQPMESLQSQDDMWNREASDCILEDVLGDAFARNYLLRHAEKEFSSENVAFLLELGTYFAMAEHDALLEDLITAARKLYTEHVQSGAMLEVHLPPATYNPLATWYKESATDSKLPSPTPIWMEAYAICLGNVKHDTFPRFRHSETAKECFALHPRRCLLSRKLRDAFAGANTPVTLSQQQRVALEYYAVATRFAANYTSLASGYLSDASVQEASTIYATYYEQWAAFGISETVIASIKKLLPEPPPSLFHPTLTKCLNLLTDVYIEWLDTAEGHEFCAVHVGVSRSLPPKAARESLHSTEDYLSGW